MPLGRSGPGAERGDWEQIPRRYEELTMTTLTASPVTRGDALAAGAVANIEKDGALDDLVAALRQAAG
jgi:hypothetical protein